MSSTAPVVIDGEYLISSQAITAYQERGNPSWYQYDGESAAAYSAFVSYRDLPPSERTLLTAYRLVKPQARTAPKRYKDWAIAYNWESRAREYDFYMDTLRLRQREKQHLSDIEAYRARLEQSSRAVFNAAIKALNLASKRLDALKPEDVDPNLFPRWMLAVTRALETATAGEAQSLAVDKLLLMFEQQQTVTDDYDLAGGDY